MKTYTLEIAGLKRELPFVDIKEDLAFASFVVLSDTELINAVAPLLAIEIGECDVIVTAEAKGIALSYEVSKTMGLKEFVVARKSMKSYMKNPLEVSVRSITTADVQHLYLDSADRNKLKGKKVCLIDDVVSTGDSLKALEELCRKAGAEVIKKACILAEGEATKREDIIYLQELPLFHKDESGEYEVIHV